MLIVRMSPLGQDDVQVGTIVTTATNDHFHVTHECCPCQSNDSQHLY